MQIALGTSSDQKISYLKEVLIEIGIAASIIPNEVKSGVSSQPITESETQLGSLNRAKAALQANPDCDFGLGIEVGYHTNTTGQYEIFCCTSIIDSRSYLVSCNSSKFLLPDFHQEILKSNKFLGDYVRDYKKDVNEPVTNYIRELIRGRKPIIKEAVRNALLQYLSKHF